MPDRHFELPAHPDLEYYRKQAKSLVKAVHSGESKAVGLASKHLNQFDSFLLSDAQLVVARELGQPSWPKQT